MTETIRLHDYQDDIKQRLFEAWKQHRSVMVQMPTGTGKTYVLASIVNELNEEREINEELRTKNVVNEERRIKNEEREINEELRMKDEESVWIIAHRRELVTQIEETVSKMLASTPTSSFLILHSSFNCSSFIKVMSIQWLSRHWKDIKGRPSLVIIDEAHHAQAKTYRMLWEQCPKAKFLGLTATPCRMDGSGFTDLFDTLITSWGISEFIEKGYLSVFDYVTIRANSREQRLIDSLEKRGADGDYQIKEMNRVLNRPASIGQLYHSVERFAKGKKGIVYAIGIDHARRIAEYYSNHGMEAAAIDSRTPATERKQLVEDFKAGKIKVLVNVDVFSEGFDCPDVEFIQMARPTLSLSKYLQQVGRGLRKSTDKEACVLIDNVGLYQVFGLPTVAWDWESMFRGTMSGKGVHAANRQNASCTVTMPDEVTARDNEMEPVVNHEQLLETIAKQEYTMTDMSRKVPGLKAWQDEGSGRWGLCRGKKKITQPIFTTVFDIRYDMAAVRFTDKSCGIVNSSGETVWKEGHCQTMRFDKNFFLVAQTPDGKSHYTDLHSLHTYKVRPKVERYGNMELLKVGRTYYSRTKRLYVNNQGINSDNVFDRKFYITILDYNTPDFCCMQHSRMDGHRWGYVCILNGDHDSFYWIYRRLADGSIIVADDCGKFYHATESKGKEYIGCYGSPDDEKKCRTKIESITAHTKSEKEGKRQRIWERAEEAIPFQSGMKWGLKVGERITIPPVYRNVKPPIGKYCAVEKNYSQWGIIAIDGTVLIEPKYTEVSIRDNGTALLTSVTGKKISVKL